MESVADHYPDSWQLAHLVWNRRAVADLIALRCDLTISPQAAGRYLRTWGIAPARGRRRDDPADPADRGAWRLDITHRRLGGLATLNPADPGGAQLLICAVDGRGRFAFALHDGEAAETDGEAADEALVCQFLSRLASQYGGPVRAVVDRPGRRGGCDPARPCPDHTILYRPG